MSKMNQQDNSDYKYLLIIDITKAWKTPPKRGLFSTPFRPLKNTLFCTILRGLKVTRVEQKIHWVTKTKIIYTHNMQQQRRVEKNPKNPKKPSKARGALGPVVWKIAKNPIFDPLNFPIWGPSNFNPPECRGVKKGSKTALFSGSQKPLKIVFFDVFSRFSKLCSFNETIYNLEITTMLCYT